MKKSPIAILLIVTALGGCSKVPLGTKAVSEQERVVHYNATRPAAKKPVEAEVGAVDPTRINHDTPAGSGMLISHSASGVAAPNALLPGESPTLSVEKEPTRSFRAFPVFVSDTDVGSVKFSPAETKAEWSLTAKGAPVVGKVKVSILGADDKEAATGDLTANDVGLDPRNGAAQTLALDPTGVPAILDYLRQNPKATRFTIKLTLEDAAGKPVLQDKSKPLELSLAMQVL